jgi:hypothetical protein
MNAVSDELLDAAVRSYNALAHAPRHGVRVVETRLDALLDLCERWGRMDLARNVLILALINRDRPEHLGAASRALGHVLAELAIPLPFDADAVMAADAEPPSDEILLPGGFFG